MHDSIKEYGLMLINYLRQFYLNDQLLAKKDLHVEA